ncbi:MAG: hypothetical protein JXR70_19270 [Spirochaetales bacterium]|nr:hypothetical protein [Spirochaetales bacterium]
MKNLVYLVVFIFLAGFAFPVDMIEEPSLNFVSPRSSALGGFHAGDSTGIERIFNNPAGIASPDETFLVFETTLGLQGPVFSIATMVISGMSGGVNLEGNQEFADLLLRINAGARVFGPLALAYAGKGISFGLFHWADLDFKSQNTSLNSTIVDNIMMTAGLGGRIILAPNHLLDIGGNVKAYVRGSFSFTRSILDIKSAIGGDLMGLLYGSEFAISVGAGLDLGVMYSLGDLLSVGLVARDISASYRSEYESFNTFLGVEPGTATHPAGYAPIDLSGGVRVSPPLGVLSRYIGGLDIYLDYNDILGFLTHSATNKYWLLHLNFGLEMKFLDVLSVRGGISEGLIAAGVGLDLTVFQIDVAAYGSEESTMPGFSPVYNLALGLRFLL